MGKGWKGGGGGRDKGHDIASCKGFPVVMGTCDAARERETSKELVNLLNEAIEVLYPSAPSEAVPSEGNASIEDMLKAEIEAVKGQRHSATQAVVSINTGVKGITLVKILRKECCPVKLVKHIFDRVEQEKMALCRFVVRVVPFQMVFYPEEDELADNFGALMRRELSLPPLPTPKRKREEEPDNDGKVDDTDAEASKKPKQAAESPEAASAISIEPPQAVSSSAESRASEPRIAQIPYYIIYKARNNNVVSREMVHRTIQNGMSGYGYGDFKMPKV